MLELESENIKKYKILEPRYKLLKKMKAKNIHDLQIDFSYIKENFEMVKLLDESTIVHNLNPNGEILFKLLNK